MFFASSGCTVCQICSNPTCIVEREIGDVLQLRVMLMRGSTETIQGPGAESRQLQCPNCQAFAGSGHGAITQIGGARSMTAAPPDRGRSSEGIDKSKDSNFKSKSKSRSCRSRSYIVTPGIVGAAATILTVETITATATIALRLRRGQRGQQGLSAGGCRVGRATATAHGPKLKAAYRVTQFCKARGHGARWATTRDRHAGNSRHRGNGTACARRRIVPSLRGSGCGSGNGNVFFELCSETAGATGVRETEARSVRGGGKFMRLLSFLARAGR
jgi:hypothetical protein